MFVFFGLFFLLIRVDSPFKQFRSTMSLLPGVADKDVSPLSQDKLCLPHHILEERGLVKVGVTVQALLDLPPSRPTQLSAV